MKKYFGLVLLLTLILFSKFALANNYKCSTWFSSNKVSVNYNSGTLNGIDYPSHDQEVNSSGYNWHYIRQIKKSENEIAFVETIQNDDGYVSRVEYFIINEKILKFKKGEQHRTELVVTSIFKKLFGTDSGYDGNCKKIN